MLDNKVVKDYVSVYTSVEAKVRAARLSQSAGQRITKMTLYSLVALIPFKDLEALVLKYLTSKKHSSSD
jgi:hypothetical protein